MCLLACAWRVLPGYPLLVLANRDEVYARPTAPLGRWSHEGGPELLAGRDLQGGGTWLGVRGGRFAALTNVREPEVPVPAGAPSRGELVPGFLSATRPPLDWLAGLEAQRYAGFNLLVSDGTRLAWVSNRAPAPQELEPGIYGLSNASLDTPWPKLTRLRADLAAVARDLPESGAPWGPASAEEGPAARLLELLRDEARPDDADLPQTGVGLAAERYLSPIFVRTPTYGTRSSTLVLATDAGSVEVWERTHGTPGSTAYARSPAPGPGGL